MVKSERELWRKIAPAVAVCIFGIVGLKWLDSHPAIVAIVMVGLLAVALRMGISK